MKHNITEAKPKFQPITVSITLENLQELNTFYAMVNAPTEAIEEHGHELFHNNENAEVDDRLFCPLFEELDKYIEGNFSLDNKV